MSYTFVSTHTCTYIQLHTITLPTGW